LSFDKGGNRCPRGKGNVLQQLNIFEDAVIAILINLTNIPPDTIK